MCNSPTPTPTVLREYVNELPEPLVPFDAYASVIDAVRRYRSALAGQEGAGADKAAGTAGDDARDEAQDGSPRVASGARDEAHHARLKTEAQDPSPFDKRADQHADQGGQASQRLLGLLRQPLQVWPLLVSPLLVSRMGRGAPDSVLQLRGQRAAS